MMMKTRNVMVLLIGLLLSLTSIADDTLSFNGMNTKQIAKPGAEANANAEKKSARDSKDCEPTVKDGTENNPETPPNKTAKSAWTEFSTRSNGDVFFFDDTRVEKDSDQISVWVRIRYKTSIMAAASYQNLTRLDCSENSETILQDTFYTDKDWTKPAMATNTNAKPKKTVQKNSAMAQLINILCKDNSN